MATPELYTVRSRTTLITTKLYIQKAALYKCHFYHSICDFRLLHRLLYNIIKSYREVIESYRVTTVVVGLKPVELVTSSDGAANELLGSDGAVSPICPLGWR